MFQRSAGACTHCTRANAFLVMIRITCIIVTALFMNNLVAESKQNRCLQEGRTWHTKGQLEFLAPLTLQECLEVYLKSEEAQGFTWFGEATHKLTNICVTFKRVLTTILEWHDLWYKQSYYIALGTRVLTPMYLLLPLGKWGLEMV